jgi:uncharacterized protein YciI
MSPRMLSFPSRAALTLLVACQCFAVAAQDKPAAPKPDLNMGRVQMVLLHQAPDATNADADAQRAAVKLLIDSGQAALAGPISGPGTLRELLVFKTEAAEPARDHVAALPMVKAGALKPEQLTWFTARNYINPPATPRSDVTYVFGLLVRGPKAVTAVTEEEKKQQADIQAGHMANINRLADLGKLVLAGPFAGGGERRGVFIFKVDTIEEAQALCDTDPAVQAGRLKVELYKWTVPAGILPKS